MASYARLKKQLEKMQAQVEAARQAELLPIIKRMQREMATHGISAADLGAVAERVDGSAKKAASKRYVKGAGAAKYRDPKSGLTWSGFGRAPGWIAGKKDRTKFLINGGDEAPRAPSKAPKAVAAKKSAAKKVAVKKPVGKQVRSPAKKVAGRKLGRSAAKKGTAGAGNESSDRTQADAGTQPSA